MNKILPILILAVSMSSILNVKLKGMPPVKPTPSDGNLPITPVAPEVPVTPVAPVTPVVPATPVAPVIPAVPVTPSPITATNPMDSRLTVHSHFTFSISNYNNYQYLTDSLGWSLYIFNADTANTSTCFSTCTIDWPPVLISDLSTVQLSDGIHMDYLSTFTRPDGSLQLVYNGYPLYYYMKDLKPGDVLGQAILRDGDYWYLITPDGNPIKS